MSMRWLNRCFLASFVWFLTTRAAPAQVETPVSLAAFDPAGFSEWVDGVTSPIVAKNGPRHVLWTKTTPPEWDGVRFGTSRQPGPRHLRIRFHAPIPVGSVMVRGGGRLSVLRASTTADDPGTDAAWLPAQRIKDATITGAEVGPEEYAVWVLPPGTKTTALRFSHTAAPADARYDGWLGGALVLAERVANVAPQAIVSTSARDEAASKIHNESNDGLWGVWDNGPKGADRPISADHAETILLVWPRPVRLRGLDALWAGFAATEVQTYSGPASQHPRSAPDRDWTPIKTFEGIENQYPRALGSNLLDFGREITTRALRVRLTKATTEGHPHLEGKTQGGKRVWLGELMALAPLETADLATALLAPAPADHPPIPVRFTLREPGFVTLVLDDADGRRVRNLVSETPFPAGANVAWWDGLDDLGADPEAARHGISHLPARFVAPGTYRVRGLVRQAIELRYEFALYNSGNPPWPTADHTGGWLANHTPPSSALFVPADRAPAASRWSSWAVTSPKAATAWPGSISTARNKAAKAGWAASGPARTSSRATTARTHSPARTPTPVPSGKASYASRP